MKKVIFLSAIALAAAVSCSKSEVVDTKFESEAIGFDTYLGRGAQTKATETTVANLEEFGVYGFYTGAQTYEVAALTTANLMDNQKVYKDGGVWKYEPARYWNHEDDYYTFFAYAPYSEGSNGGSPVIKYTVKGDLAAQEDVIYAVNAKNVTKTSCTNNGTTAVPFQFKHALARLAVKANAQMYHADGSEVTEEKPLVDKEEPDNTFTITNISITGKFCTTGTMNLTTPYTITDGVTTGGPVWNATPSEKPVTYNLTGTVEQKLNDRLYDFSANTEKGYLMMMPTEFSEANPAVLSVTYYVTYAGKKSNPITKTVNVPTNFEQGKAYSINIKLQRDSNNAITFTVSEVSGWGTGSTQTPVING